MRVEGAATSGGGDAGDDEGAVPALVTVTVRGGALGGYGLGREGEGGGAGGDGGGRGLRVSRGSCQSRVRTLS